MKLPSTDQEFLNRRFQASWATTASGSEGLLVIKNLAVNSAKYDRGTVDLLIRVPAGYPMVALDMFYVDPPLQLLGGGRPPQADQFESHGGRQWQRFSRHLKTPWRPGVDSLKTFMAPVLLELCPH